MVKSEFAVAVDDIQKRLAPLFKRERFKKRGRTYNRVTDDGLTQVVNFQMGASDPPGTTYHPGLRENLHGLFTVNLAVYVPEVGRWHGGEAKAWVSSAYCTIRTRLSRTQGADDGWWPASASDAVVDEISAMMDETGFAYLERFATRDDILSEIDPAADRSPWMLSPPRIVAAIILAARGETERARQLLEAQTAWALQEGKTGHAKYVSGLMEEMLGR